MNVFDRSYKRYDAWYDRHAYAYHSEIKALEKMLPASGRGLEVGVGTGRFAAALNISVGIDPSYPMLEIARQRGVNARWGYGEDLPFLAASFDYAALIISFCFLRDPLKVLMEIRRVLRDNGSVVIAIIDKDSSLGRLYRRKKSPFYRVARFFSVAEVQELMQQAGFRHFEYCQTLFDQPGRLSAVQSPRKGYGQGGFVVIKAKNILESKRRN